MTCSPSGCTGFGTSVGWDATTGWGTPHVPALISAIVALGGGVRAAAWGSSYGPNPPLLAPFADRPLGLCNKNSHADAIAVPLGDSVALADPLGIVVADGLTDAFAHFVVDEDCHADAVSVLLGQPLSVALADPLGIVVADGFADAFALACGACC